MKRFTKILLKCSYSLHISPFDNNSLLKKIIDTVSYSHGRKGSCQHVKKLSWSLAFIKIYILTSCMWCSKCYTLEIYQPGKIHIENCMSDDVMGLLSKQWMSYWVIDIHVLNVAYTILIRQYVINHISLCQTYWG